ncbi:DUF2180 family protein [Streptomyces virginiae]|uniref:DUF2180 family protein n=2 Tax=Streptomyces virginiae TaxID=1961 RepID=UPI0032C24AB6
MKPTCVLHCAVVGRVVRPLGDVPASPPEGAAHESGPALVGTGLTSSLRTLLPTAYPCRSRGTPWVSVLPLRTRIGQEAAMDCYECLASPGTASTAVAVCRECGVGLCSRHLHVEQHEMHLAAGLGKSTTRLPARRVVCPACAKAERSR